VATQAGYFETTMPHTGHRSRGAGSGKPAPRPGRQGQDEQQAAKRTPAHQPVFFIMC
jgi:hypothetical protein